MDDLFFHQPKPEYVYVLDADEDLREAIDYFRGEVQDFSVIMSRCAFCDATILTLWSAKTLPPVLVLACLRCLKEKRAESRFLTESN